MNTATPDSAEVKLSKVARIAALFRRDTGGNGLLSTGASARLRRMTPERWDATLPDLIPMLLKAGVEPPAREGLRRHALLVHVVALLAGTGGDLVQDASRATGKAMHDAGFSEARLLRLLAARGPLLEDQVIRLARFLAAKRAAPLDLRPLARLLLDTEAEEARIDIARAYYRTSERKDSADAASVPSVSSEH